MPVYPKRHRSQALRARIPAALCARFHAALALTLAVMAIPAARASESPDPRELLAQADAIRNPSESYKMRIVVSSEDSDQTFDVYLKGTSKTVIVTKAPARDVGRNMLMLDRDFYAYVPNLKRTMRLSLAQKLLGQVANGDIARTRWSGDYEPKAEKVATKGETQLLLEGTKPNLTYQKIRLWLETASGRPLRADFLSVDGKSVLKHASFEGYRPIAGRERPGKIRIEDTNRKSSSIVIQSMEAATLADSFFAERNIETLR